jgi:Ulp1 family protease
MQKRISNDWTDEELFKFLEDEENLPYVPQKKQKKRIPNLTDEELFKVLENEENWPYVPQKKTKKNTAGDFNKAVNREINKDLTNSILIDLSNENMPKLDDVQKKMPSSSEQIISLLDDEESVSSLSESDNVSSLSESDNENDNTRRSEFAERSEEFKNKQIPGSYPLGKFMSPKTFDFVFDVEDWVSFEPGKLLTSGAIDACFAMLQKKAPNDYLFCPVDLIGETGLRNDLLRQFKDRIRLYLDQVVFFPVHLAGFDHFALLVIKRGYFKVELIVYDSFPNEKYKAELNRRMDVVIGQLNDSDPVSTYSKKHAKSATQSNGYDCGVFVLENAFAMSQGKELNPKKYTSKEVAQWRKHWSNEIVKNIN